MHVNRYQIYMYNITKYVPLLRKMLLIVIYIIFNFTIIQVGSATCPITFSNLLYHQINKFVVVILQTRPFLIPLIVFSKDCINNMISLISHTIFNIRSKIRMSISRNLIQVSIRRILNQKRRLNILIKKNIQLDLTKKRNKRIKPIYGKKIQRE